MICTAFPNTPLKQKQNTPRHINDLLEEIFYLKTCFFMFKNYFKKLILFYFFFTSNVLKSNKK